MENLKENLEEIITNEKVKDDCRKVKEHLEETRTRLGSIDVSGILAEAVVAITALEARIAELESAIAEQERHNAWRKERQMEGIEAAINRGVAFGRPRKETPEEFEQLKEQWLNKQISTKDAASRLGIGRDTFLRWVKTR
ncbi:MAG: hypothetical protein LUE22_02770 [Oscillospiraceae bacterium]|nr:hypothetical protein [Oscillospiraceae bacterium]